MIDNQTICLKVVELCREVATYIREESQRLNQLEIESKSRNNFVTYVDKESEKRLVENLSLIFPEAGFLTEEGSVELGTQDYIWVVDPLDGTTNYIHHLSPYSISIALMCRNEILLACVYEVTLDEAFYAWKGGFAWLNGKKIRVSNAKELDGSLIGHGIPYQVESRYRYVRQGIFELHGRSTLRHLGSAAAEICYAAAGRFDAYVHDNLSPWDVAAGILILQEAGGLVTDLSGGSNYIFGRELVASNGFIHKLLLQHLDLGKY